MAAFDSSTIVLSNGKTIPALGFGCAFGNWTDQSKFMGFLPDEGWAAIPAAIRAGFRHFDGAYVYGTHKILGISLGNELAKGELKRDDFFITTKVFHPPAALALNSINKSFDMADESIDIKSRILIDFERSLDELNLGYVDLLLMHWPGSFNSNDKERGDRIRKEVWEVFEEIYESGRARSIGVSNFLVRHLEPLLETAKVKPHVNQIEINPYISQADTQAFCADNGITLQAWAPFGSGATGVLQDPVIVELSEKYHKNVGQIILRWLNQRGIIALPKSSNEGRMRGNLDIFDFVLEDADVERISALDQNKSSVSTSESIA
jgi:diketogulonate reductase-like aldo/keto reductase